MFMPHKNLGPVPLIVGLQLWDVIKHIKGNESVDLGITNLKAY